MTTYTLAYDQVLLAVVPDGEDIAAAVAEEGRRANEEFEDYTVEDGLTLTDELEPGDKIVWQGHGLGVISDEHDTAFEYAVRRTSR